MYPASFRRVLSLFFVLCLFFALSAQAGKRRAVAHPSAGALITAGLVTGTIVDDTTGAPIAAVRVTIGGTKNVTGPDGVFAAVNVTGFGFILIEATRSGYQPATAKLTKGGDQQVTIRMTPTPTVRAVKKDGTTLNLDFESLEFGYAVPFSGYRQYQYEEFCKNGVSVRIDRSEIKQINGPATVVSGAAPCCPSKDVLKINLELKTGEKVDVFFIDSCEAGVTRIDLIARDHTQGQFVFVPFTELNQVVFP